MKLWRTLKALVSWYQATDAEIDAMSLLIGKRALRNEAFRDYVRAAISRTEAQAGTLLTHVSLMTAVTGVFLATIEASSVYALFLSLELVGYLVLALLAVRCLLRENVRLYPKLKSEFDDTDGRKEEKVFDGYFRELVGELVLRDRLLRFSFVAIYVLTSVLIVMLVAGLPYETLAPVIERLYDR